MLKGTINIQIDNLQKNKAHKIMI